MSQLTEAAHNALSVLRAMTRTYPYNESIWRAIDELKQGLLVEAIETHAQDGKVAIVESGRDCDCVEYHGKVCIIDATLEAYNKLYDEVSEWVDGPFRFEITSPSEAKRVKYTSRDLVMEAHEDGHPHSIRSEFP